MIETHEKESNCIKSTATFRKGEFPDVFIIWKCYCLPFHAFFIIPIRFPTAPGSLGHYTRLAGRRHCIGAGKLSDLRDLPLLRSYIINFSSEFSLYYKGYKPFSWLAITTVYVHIKLFTLRNDYAQNSKFLVKLYIFIIT